MTPVEDLDINLALGMSSLGVIGRWRYSANQKGSNGESCHQSPITFKTRSLAFSVMTATFPSSFFMFFIRIDRF